MKQKLMLATQSFEFFFTLNISFCSFISFYRHFLCKNFFATNLLLKNLCEVFFKHIYKDLLSWLVFVLFEFLNYCFIYAYYRIFFHLSDEFLTFGGLFSKMMTLKVCEFLKSRNFTLTYFKYKCHVR